MKIAGLLQIVGGITAVVAFSLEMRRRFRVKRQEATAERAPTQSSHRAH